MIVLLPVSRYRIRYQVGSGRPYSAFERLVLEAIGEGQHSLSALETTFSIHRRLIIESIVTLMEAGWIAFERSTHKLVTTPEGKRAIGRPGELPKTIIVSERTDYVISERVHAQLAKGSDVTFSPKAALQPYWSQVAILPVSDIPHSTEPGMVVPLLRRFEGEWIRWCGPVSIVRDGADFCVVDVDTVSGAITGIPAKWMPLLRSDLLGRARQKEQQLILAGNPLIIDSMLEGLVQKEVRAAVGYEPALDEWAIEPSLDRIVAGSDHHDFLLSDRLESARSYLVMVTGTLHISTVRRLEPNIRAAIARGLLIYIIWGSGPEHGRDAPHREAFDLLKKIEYDSRSPSQRGHLSLARSASGSHAKMLLSDASDTLEVIVGSYDWLGESRLERWLDLSLTFREAGPVARICRLLADLACADDRLSAGAGVTRLRHAAAELEQRIAEEAQQRALLLRKAKEQKLESAATVSRTAQAGDLDLGDFENSSEGNVAGLESECDADTSHELMPEAAWRARLVIGRQHHALLQTLGTEARRRLVVCCHRWGLGSEATFRALREALERGCQHVDLRYGVDLTPGSDHDLLATEFEKLGGVIKEVPRLHAKIAAIDDDIAIVTSFDWLSPDPGRNRTSVGEIGFVLRGKGVGSALLKCAGLSETERKVTIEGEYVTSLRINGIRSISSLEWAIAGEVAPGWHVIVGDNGSGKTSVLRALAIALIGSENARILRQDWGTWLHRLQDTATVEVTFQRLRATEPVSTRVICLTWTKTEEGTSLSEEPSLRDADPFSSGYGPFRRLTGGDPELERQLAAFPKLARHLSLFDERVALTEGLVWLQELRFRSLEGDGEAMLLLNRTIDLVNEWGLLPHGVRLSQVRSDSVTFHHESDADYNIEELSDGYRAILSLIFDIIRQLALNFGAARVFDADRTGIIAVPGIILIDEIDAHLHPSWQRTIGQWFRSHFPFIQFIVTTHSPLICQAAEGGTVFRLPNPADDCDSGGMLDGSARARLVYGNILEAYASGAFGDEVSRSETSKGHLQRLAVLNQKELTEGLSPEEENEQAELRTILPSTAHITKWESPS